MNKPQKHTIVVYAIEFPEIERADEGFAQLKKADKTFNHPFGYNDLKFHGPEKTANGYRVYATVRYTVDQYVRKCAYSYSTPLRNICYTWIKEFFPDNSQYFYNICLEADAIRKNMEERNKKKVLNG